MRGTCSRLAGASHCACCGVQALPLNDVATSLAIDIGAAALFAFLLRNDLQARMLSRVLSCLSHPAGA